MKEKDYSLWGEQEVSSNLKGRRMQMNILRTKQVSHVGSRDDHGQPIAGGDDQKCRRRVGSRSTKLVDVDLRSKKQHACPFHHHGRIDHLHR